MFITPEELMAGGNITYDIEIPEDILLPGGNGSNSNEALTKKRVKIKPLTVRDVQLIAKAAKDDEVLTSVLMINKAVIEPKLKQNEIANIHSGLIKFLVDHINRISGLSTTEDEMKEIVESPIVQAFFVLAKEFNWTPEQVKELTIGQIMGYLEMLNRTKRAS